MGIKVVDNTITGSGGIIVAEIEIVVVKVNMVEFRICSCFVFIKVNMVELAPVRIRNPTIVSNNKTLEMLAIKLRHADRSLAAALVADENEDVEVFTHGSDKPSDEYRSVYDPMMDPFVYASGQYVSKMTMSTRRRLMAERGPVAYKREVWLAAR